MTKKVCKLCKSFVEGTACPLCGGTQFSETWKGKVAILKPNESEIAKKLRIEKEGVYTIKIK